MQPMLYKMKNRAFSVVRYNLIYVATFWVMNCSQKMIVMNHSQKMIMMNHSQKMMNHNQIVMNHSQKDCDEP